jgi:threonine/homoserine/homoserine lactone efflux protein
LNPRVRRPGEGGTTGLADAVAFGLALGFSLTIPPGPMNALIASRAARSLRAGIVTGFGAMSADLVLGLLVYALRSVVDLSTVVRYIYAIGAVVMAYLGYRLLTGPAVVVRPEEEAGLRTYTQALAIGVSNPFQVLWWLTAGLAFAYLGGLPLFVALFGAILVWVLVFPYAVHLGTRERPDIARAVIYGSGAILIAFAAYFAYLAL